MDQDILLITANPAEVGWSLDIDIVNGEARLVPGEINVRLQRAAVASYIVRGSIPGQELVGADWPGYLSGSVSLVECDNQVKALMEQYAGVSSMEEAPYPLYMEDADGLHITLTSLKASGTGGLV